MTEFRDAYDVILTEIRVSLDKVDAKQIDILVRSVFEAEQVFVIGVGRVMLSLQALAKRWNHLGIAVHCVGDINEPAITDKDLLIVGSASGESLIPVSIARKAKEHGARIAHIGSNPESSLAPITDCFVRIPVNTKLKRTDEISSRQIMTSLFEQSLYVLADAVAMMIVGKKGFDKGKLWRHHANLE